MKKKYWLALGLGTIMLLNSSMVWANSSISLMVNGTVVNTDVAPKVEEGVTFVPISFIAKELGATVDWKSPDITIKQGNSDIKCTVYSKEAFINGEKLDLVAEPKLEWGRVLVPLRFVTEALGAKVDYDGAKGIINVTKEGEEVALQPQPEQERDYSVFLDETSGTYIYERSYLSNEQQWEREYFLHDTVSQSWGELIAKDWSIYDNGNNQYPRVNEKGYLDLKDKELHQGVQYIESPNGKWRYIEKREWSTSTGRDEIGFVQDVETGVIKQVFKSKTSPTVYSLPDSTFFIEISVPGEEGSQWIYPDDLFIYDPASDKMTHIATGHRSYYIQSKGIIMYEKNNKPYEYNLNTKQIRAITEAEYQIYFDLYYSERDQMNEEDAPVLPPKEEREKFQEIKVETIQDYVGNLTVNGKTEKVTFMFQRDHQTYVPVKNVMNLVGIEVNKKPDSTKEAVLGTQRIALNGTNSATFDERLYFSQAVLEELGLEVQVKFNMPKP